MSGDVRTFLMFFLISLLSASESGFTPPIPSKGRDQRTRRSRRGIAGVWLPSWLPIKCPVALISTPLSLLDGEALPG